MQTQLTSLVPVSLIEDLISIGMGRGADFAEVYVERGVGSSLGLEEKDPDGSPCISLGVDPRPRGH